MTTYTPIPTHSARAAAAAYLERGMLPVPVPVRTKGPVVKEWPALRLTPADLPKWFPDDRTSNLGLHLDPSVSLADVDLDSAEAVAAGNRWLPRTDWVSGRTNKPRSHHWFRPDGPVQYAEFNHLDGSRVLELRAGHGLQTVAPPGVHELGDEIVWHRFDGDPSPIPAADLERLAGEVAALAILVRHWPGKGSRDDAFLGLIGGLLRARWSVPRVETFVAAIADLTGDEEARKRVATVVRSEQRLKSGENARGWTSLADHLGADGSEVVRRVREWLRGGEPPPDGPGPWPDLIPLLSPLPDLPPFPTDVLPPWLKDWATATAEALQVPEDLPATLGLAVCSAGVAQKFVANPRPGWVEPVNTYWVTALPPSDRKTQTFTRAVAPVFEVQDRVRDESSPARREAEAAQKAVAKRVSRLEDQYAKADDPEERRAVMEELKKTREELDRMVVPVLPQLVVDDETPDNLAKTICEQGGRLLQASAEGTLFENIERWSQKPSFDVYLKAYSGDPMSIGRVTRARTECPHPALTCAIAPQPAVIEALGEDPSLAGRGFLARWFYSLPRSLVGRRRVGAPAAPPAVRDAYHAGVLALWGLPAGADEDGRPKAWTVQFTTEADEVIRAFERELEPRLAEGEDLSFLHGWAGKAAGGAVRIATVLHLADAAGRDGHRMTPVPVEVAARAVRLVRDYLVPHATAAFGLLGADPRVNRAKKLVKWFVGGRLATFTVREAYHAVRAWTRTVDDLLPILDLIERHHYIRAAQVPQRPGRGRPRSPVYEVNPAAFDGDPGRPPAGGSDGPSGGDRGPPNSAHSGNCGGRSGVPGRSEPAAEPGADAGGSGPGDGAHNSQNAHKSTPPDPDDNIALSGNCGTQTDRTIRADAELSDGPEAGAVNPAHKSHNAQNSARRETDGISALSGICGSEFVPPNSAGQEGPDRPRSVGGPGEPAHKSQNAHNSVGPARGDGPDGGDASVLGRAVGYDGGVFADTPYLLVRTPDDLQAVANAVAESRYVGLDCETTGLDPRADRVRLLALDCDTNDGGRLTYLVDAFAVDPAPLWEALAEAEVVIHNAAFDLGFLGRLGFVPGRVHDTLLLSNVLYAGGHTRGVAPLRHGLKDCCERELGRALAKDLQASDWSGSLTHDQLVYAATDAAVLVSLYRALWDKLKADGLGEAAAIESAAVPAVAWLAASGVPFDSARWRALAKQAAEEAGRAKAALDAAAPERPGTLFGESWNWDSPDQVRDALALAGCAVESTADGVLAALDHPLAALLRDYREAQKRATTYGDTWLKHVAADGRVYPRWVQLGANSGRMACSAPNMQNLPRGEYRKCVAAPPGRVLVKADYSQVELRIAAKVSGDKALIAAYERGEDLHTLTARQVLGIAEVTKEHRQLAKALNFGLLYGMGARGFRDYARSHYGLELTEAQADEYREAFFRGYPGLRRWHRSMGDAPRDTRTLAGRRVRQVEHFTEKLNLPVQGTGADGLKRALALLWERRAECPAAVPVLAVHDELVVESPEGDAERAAAWLKRAMLDGMAPLVTPVPIEVEVKVARTWGGD
jgi:DNA polymerase I-like protein with 3'-5' exonuclease and polymerase domains